MLVIQSELVRRTQEWGRTTQDSVRRLRMQPEGRRIESSVSQNDPEFSQKDTGIKI